MITQEEAYKKWLPVIDELGIKDPLKRSWLSKYMKAHIEYEQIDVFDLNRKFIANDSKKLSSLGNFNVHDLIPIDSLELPKDLYMYIDYNKEPEYKKPDDTKEKTT